MALAASAVFTAAAATRYRLPLEPALVVLASYALVRSLGGRLPGPSGQTAAFAHFAERP